MEEIWKDIAGFEGKYEVSNLGNVRSLNWRGTKKIRNLSPRKINTGYLRVLLSDNGKSYAFTVHRLVALAFLENPLDFSDVNHKDENKENNCVDNLEWCSHHYNTDCFFSRHPDYWKNKKQSDKYGRRSNLRVLQCDKNGNVVREWANSRTIFVETGMSDWSISECCRGNRKTAYGYKWQYANAYNGSSETV